jgi:hypothetical protein
MVAWLLASIIACSPADHAQLADASALVQRGFERDAAARLLDRSADDCALRQLAHRALEGWDRARAAAKTGGASESIAPVAGALSALTALKNRDLAHEAEYASTLIRAAIAAAQDERPELELLLTHARDLGERLHQRGRPALWPRPFNLAAGELWLEVDRFADARNAFARAVRSEPSAAALVGLARASSRLGDVASACDAYRQVSAGAPVLVDEARAFLVQCR